MISFKGTLQIQRKYMAEFVLEDTIGFVLRTLSKRVNRVAVASFAASRKKK